MARKPVPYKDVCITLPVELHEDFKPYVNEELGKTVSGRLQELIREDLKNRKHKQGVAA